MDKESLDGICRSYRQGGVRYNDIVSDTGSEFKFQFEKDLYMYASEIWEQVCAGEKFTHLDFEKIFGNKNPVNVEIGIGNAEFIAHHSKLSPDENWFGIEAFLKIFRKAVARCEKLKGGNVRIVQFDAEFFVRLLSDKSVKAFYVNFPDPWPKAKHTKRRLLKRWFIELMREKLVDGGMLTIATDHRDYAREITENICDIENLKSVFPTPFINDIGDYYKTKYYRKFADISGVHFFKYEKRS